MDTKTLTREEEIKEAYMDNGGMLQSNLWFAFKAGAEWADTHPVIWHEASEMPKEEEWILVQFDEDLYDTYLLRHFNADIFCAWCKKTNVIRWAYVRDLLPKGGEK